MDSGSVFAILVFAFLFILFGSYLGCKLALSNRKNDKAARDESPVPKRRVVRIPMTITEVGTDKDGSYAQLFSDRLWSAGSSNASVRFRGEYTNALQVGQKMEINVDAEIGEGLRT